MKVSERWGRRILWAAAVAYVVFPVAFYASVHLRQFFVFGNYFIWPFHEYRKPEMYGLPHAKNFYINSVGEIRLGAWYIPPKGIWQKMSERSNGHEPQSWMLEDYRPVIIYYHGHAHCRACDYRVGLYKTLTQSEKLDAHLFTFDYRGFGDSTNVLPDREGVLHDSTVVFDYVRKLLKNNDSRILVWGHSLGTAVAVQLIEAFTELHRSPMGLVLESPFNSLCEAAYHWPVTLPYKFLPWIGAVTDTLRDHDETFYETEELAGSINVPVLMMHAPDDALVSFELGQKLLSALQALSKAPVHFYKANDSYSLGHRYVFKDPGVQVAVADFIRRHGKVTLPVEAEHPERNADERAENVAEDSHGQIPPNQNREDVSEENLSAEENKDRNEKYDESRGMSQSPGIPEDEL